MGEARTPHVYELEKVGHPRPSDVNPRKQLNLLVLNNMLCVHLSGLIVEHVICVTQ